MLHNNTEVKLGKLSKTRKTDFLIKTKLEKQDEEVVGCECLNIMKKIALFFEEFSGQLKGCVIPDEIFRLFWKSALLDL